MTNKIEELMKDEKALDFDNNIKAYKKSIRLIEKAIEDNKKELLSYLSEKTGIQRGAVLKVGDNPKTPYLVVVKNTKGKIVNSWSNDYHVLDKSIVLKKGSSFFKDGNKLGKRKSCLAKQFIQ